MGNERKTENIVRAHFSKFSNIHIEEQKSDNHKIKKLLQNASKKGDKHGLPEFLISANDYPDLLIVIECKGDIKKHESKNVDKYSEFAVDGVLLYASFLAKEFDVIAIAVSGENTNEIKISHFLHLKGEARAIPKFSNKLLNIESYLDGYIKSDEKFTVDYISLLAYTKTLNDNLHSIKIKESQRSLLISGILIALEDKAFEVSYKLKHLPEDLATILVSTIYKQLKNANLNNKKLDNLNTAYGFIKTHTSLSSEEGILSTLIDQIDNKVNKFIKTYKYFDVLGQFYIEFLRYANSDKGLGIVLTPPHITELFAELAGVNKDSVVIDNCTGTGGFLISSMSKMIKNSYDDVVKIAEIKKNQLIGIEYQDDIFALACSNMFIHQDGKSNIIHGNCFDANIIEKVKALQPTVGMLNPPYQSSKTPGKRDKEELDFVLNNLDMLQPSGTCIAIVPMQCVLATSGEKFELKKKLISKHTLEAVLSMPDELFINSDVGVITAVMVITAHKPHRKNKQTFFGYWKDDGFIKRKNKGRIDAFNKWKGIMAEWVDDFINRSTKPGMSINKCVTAEDEWCAEAYMETDYSKLNKDHFIEDLKKYILFEQLYGFGN